MSRQNVTMERWTNIVEYKREERTHLILHSRIPIADPFAFIEHVDSNRDAKALAKVTGGKIVERTFDYAVEWIDREPYRRACGQRFIEKHGLTDEDCEDEVSLTLFAIEHPDARG
jgi:hypothetical protein